MKIGVLGSGKLGMPVALAIESKGHQVTIYDKSPQIINSFNSRKWPFAERGIDRLLQNTNIKASSTVDELVRNSEIIFVAVQTPHQPEYEGITRLPKDRADFDYTYLITALKEVAEACCRLETTKIVATISTCLPMTYQEKIKPLLNKYTKYVYTPQFIAMGTTIEDYLSPEFNLIGVESERAADKLEDFYATINSAPNLRTNIVTAEAIKVLYNTFITAKTVLGNSAGELAHKTGARFDDIFKSWELSNKRLMSAKYLRAGVGDGGGCHPRDNIALSYLADKIKMSHNIWEDLMLARERQMDWLADLALDKSHQYGLPITILGKSFKPESNITTGSPAILLANLLRERGVDFDHPEENHLPEYSDPRVFILATAHQKYKKLNYPEKSVIIDPFRLLNNKNYENKRLTIISIGANY